MTDAGQEAFEQISASLIARRENELSALKEWVLTATGAEKESMNARIVELEKYLDSLPV